MFTLAITAACAGTPEEPKSGHVTLEGQDPRILIHDGSGPAMQALLLGQLVYNASTKCLAVEASGQPDSPVALVWPPETRPIIKDGRRGVILRYKELALLEGTEVRIGGGFVDWVKHPPPGWTPPDACIAESSNAAIFQVNPISPVS
ncbi:hypothetical protein ACQP1V_27430 [Microtetraspora malaysiensis]|uniref:hypothetical protein n=1 Tax=Microtetraspora malaysiensis TaxID=161358 RepID=UPI003D9493B5